METTELIEFFLNRNLKGLKPVKMSCGVVQDVEYFVKIQMLRIDAIGGKEKEAAIERLTELKNILSGS